MTVKPFTYLAPIAPFEYLAPTSVDEAVEALDTYGAKAKLIAGGTDITISLKDRAVHPEVVIDISRLRNELAGITLKEGNLRIGALVTFAEIEKAPQVARFALALSQAASQVGTVQIRNLGTIGGNLANASPSADSAPPLIALSANVHARSRQGERDIAVQDLFTDVKKTVLRPNEIITYVELPANKRISSCWMRATKRNENAISTVSVAVASEINGDKFGPSRVSLGSAAPTPILARKSSARLSGSPIDPETIEAAGLAAKEECIPSKRALRAGPEYRRHLVYVLTKRVIQNIADGSR